MNNLLKDQGFHAEIAKAAEKLKDIGHPKASDISEALQSHKPEITPKPEIKVEGIGISDIPTDVPPVGKAVDEDKDIGVSHPPAEDSGESQSESVEDPPVGQAVETSVSVEEPKHEKHHEPLEEYKIRFVEEFKMFFITAIEEQDSEAIDSAIEIYRVFSSSD